MAVDTMYHNVEQVILIKIAYKPCLNPDDRQIWQLKTPFLSGIYSWFPAYFV